MALIVSRRTPKILGTFFVGVQLLRQVAQNPFFKIWRISADSMVIPATFNQRVCGLDRLKNSLWGICYGTKLQVKTGSLEAVKEFYALERKSAVYWEPFASPTRIRTRKKPFCMSKNHTLPVHDVRSPNL